MAERAGRVQGAVGAVRGSGGEGCRVAEGEGRAIMLII